MKIAKNLLMASTICILFGLVVFLGIVGYYSRKLPSLDALTNYNPKLVTTVYSRDNEIIAEFARERRKYLPTQDMPKTVVNAFVAAEDSDFFHHRGINPVTMLRAAWKDFRAGARVQGGSTITQQVAKNFLLSSEKKLDRKIKEVLLAFRIEKALTKDQIINLYLNQIFLGNGAYGVEAASRIYFGKSAAQLTIAEAAILGGLPRAPSRDNPVNDPAAAKARQKYVLGRMLQTDRITKAEYEAALQEPIKIVVTPSGLTTEAPYLAEYVRRDLIQRLGEEKVYEGGLSVYTTVNLKNQIAAQNALNHGLREVDKRMGLRRPSKRLMATEIDKFLKSEHEKITEDFYNYKILLPDEQELKSPIPEGEPTPLQANKNYDAVVTGKSAKDKALIVKVGTRTGKILPADYGWAMRANPDEVYAEKVIRNPYLEYKPGDVITVEVKTLKDSKDSKNGEVTFALQQNPLVQGALISYNDKTGGLEAIVGGYDFEVTKSQFNRATQALRQPGSSFKPFVYGAAIESGLTPSTIIVDSPIVYTDQGEQQGLEKVWKPGNYSEKFYGDTTLRNALAFSRNVPSIKLAQFLKISTVIDFAKRMGITSPLQPDLSLALGSSAVGLNEMVLAWTPFVNKGRKLRGYFITKITDRAGETVYEDAAAQEAQKAADSAAAASMASALPPNGATPPTAAPADPNATATATDAAKDPNQVISPEVAYIVTTLLKSVVDYGTGVGAQALGRPVAGKTGTTNDYKDAWFLGYTTDTLSGVWVGFDEDRPIGRNETGTSAAVPIWTNYMLNFQPKAEKGANVDFEMPKNVIRVTVDSKTGDLPTARTEKTISEYYIDGNAPGQPVPTEAATPVNGKKPLPNQIGKNVANVGNSTVSSLDSKIKTRIITGNPDFTNPQQQDPSTHDEGLDEMMREDL